jgi:dienelactone hydrolase
MSEQTYDPFIRGIHPAGVRSVEWTDKSRDRTLPIEIYYPASSANEGRDRDPNMQDTFLPPGGFTGTARRKQAAVRDADESPGNFPVIVFAHGYAGDRRESSFLCTHLATHGYRVISADHVGSTYSDVERRLQSPDCFVRANIMELARARFGDVPFLLSAAEQEFKGPIESAGVTGVSMGGWTSYIAPSCDARVKVVVPLCPGGAEGPLSLSGPNALGDALNWEWKSPAAVMTLVGDRDNWLPLYGQLKLFEMCPASDKCLVVLQRADHQHFCDDLGASHESLREFTRTLGEIDQDPQAPPWTAMSQLMAPYASLMQEQEMNEIICGLTTWQMDRVLKSSVTRPPLDVSKLRDELRARSLSAYVLELQ